ncbi:MULTISPECIES: polysaccharide pyruvyl transferase family protein [unclassified Sphingobacterium]|uniref:polysaccharide pyruvyl transferase family protein n=1 Tax=unclassified Sphingobacterium TaxID=2609468 RepID=UPI0020C44217|nr:MULTISPECIES: polysaccharide pyruvyl transferase family protein [unclassified Sphingobacterium]
MKIGIKGAYGETNFGDDLLMRVFEDYFIKEFPEDELNFEGEFQPYVSELLKKGTYLNPNFDADLLVYGGGTQFFSFSEQKPITLKSRFISLLKNPKRLIEKLNEKPIKHNIPKAFLGFGIGPFFSEDSSQQLAKQKVSEAKFVGVRDNVSLSYCKKWDVKATLGADVVFSSYFKVPEYSKTNRQKKKIGIIVRDWKWESSGANYINKLKEIYYENSTDLDLEFIVFAPLKDKYWMDELKDEKIQIWNPEKHSIDEFLAILNNYDGFISARYHGAIIGVLLNKPVICIEIEPKLRILTEQVKELLLWGKPFNKENLYDQLNKLDYSIDYSASISVLRSLADDMLIQFKHLINGK